MGPPTKCPHCGTPVGGAVGHTLCATEAANDRANLAEAAPGLLEALQTLIYFHDTDDTPGGDPWAAARAAVAKAAGKE